MTCWPRREMHSLPKRRMIQRVIVKDFMNEPYKVLPKSAMLKYKDSDFNTKKNYNMYLLW